MQTHNATVPPTRVKTIAARSAVLPLEWKQNANVVMTNALEGEDELIRMSKRLPSIIRVLDRPLLSLRARTSPNRVAPQALAQYQPAALVPAS